MGGKNTTKIQHREDTGQYTVTIPQGLADAMGLHGAEVTWQVESRDRLSVRVETRGGSDD